MSFHRARCEQLKSTADFFSVRFVQEHSERLAVRQNILQEVDQNLDTGAMVTVIHAGGLGYAATSDTSTAGLQNALSQAEQWARASAGHTVTDYSQVPLASVEARYETPVKSAWQSLSLQDKIALLMKTSESMAIHEEVVDWYAALWRVQTQMTYWTSQGGLIEQSLAHLTPMLSAVANRQTDTHTRTFGEHCNQGGLELLAFHDFENRARPLAEEALSLLDAPNCPTDTTHLLLAPDQMILQIHESIGHPLELDRILGDERNYAGTSFVTLDMFGTYQYGSNLLNVTFDPTRSSEFASYGYDDDGTLAERVHIIKDGILERPLGGTISQTRANMRGASSTRACSWNRPPIDRMANLNVEPGEKSFDELVGSIEKGVMMRTNASWSIDDSRNKFQFGCEIGQLIENGELTKVVKNPCYRGISATFWRNLEAVGQADTSAELGTPYCGKGEPNQAIRVGHASPACVFANVDVFGGEN